MAVLAVHPITEKDLSAALIYGEIKYINHRYVFADELDGDDVPQSFVSKMEKSVDDFDPDHDFLLIAGDHLQLLYMSALLADRWGSYRVLRYDRKAGGYIAIRISVGDDNVQP